MKQTFKKQEHLCNKKHIEMLFKSEHKFLMQCLSVRWQKIPKQTPHDKIKVLLGVSKKNFKHAVDRNYIKRLLRECYRKNKHILHTPLEGENYILHISLSYTGHKLPQHIELKKIVINALQKVVESL